VNTECWGRGIRGARAVLTALVAGLTLTCTGAAPGLGGTRVYQLDFGQVAQPAAGELSLSFDLSPAEASASRAWLELGALPDARSVLVNGERVADLGYDLTSGEIDLFGHLVPGLNTISLSPVTSRDAVIGAVLEPPVELMRVHVRGTLAFAPAVSISHPVIHQSAAPGHFLVHTEITGALEGGELQVSLLDGERELASASAPVVPGSSQEIPITVPDQALWTPALGRVVLPWLSVRLLDRHGATIDHVASRRAVADIRYGSTGLLLNGSPLRIWAALFFDRGGDARESLVRTAARLHRAGVNALETHGWVPDRELVAAAEELGLYLVVLPRCPARVPREYSEHMVPEIEQALTRAMVAEIQRLERSPTMLFWEREKSWMHLPGIRRPAVMFGEPEDDLMLIPLGRAVSGADLTLSEDAGLPSPRWIIEVIPEDAENRSPLDPAVTAAGLARWRADGGLGMVLPVSGRDGAIFDLPDELLDALAEGRPADVAASLPSRGPADLLIQVSRGGEPLLWKAVDLLLPGLPPQSAFTDRQGVARIRCWWEGAATVEVAGQRRRVELVSGRYQGERWVPQPQTVRIELD
jgi:hypothetical protein